jgi:hypothetical protein
MFHNHYNCQNYYYISTEGQSLSSANGSQQTEALVNTLVVSAKMSPHKQNVIQSVNGMGTLEIIYFYILTMYKLRTES